MPYAPDVTVRTRRVTTRHTRCGLRGDSNISSMAPDDPAEATEVTDEQQLRGAGSSEPERSNSPVVRLGLDDLRFVILSEGNREHPAIRS